MSNDTSVITIDNVVKNVQPNFWNKPLSILKDISFKVKENELFGFIGSNGAGKTTLIKCMLGLVNYQGTIRFFDNKDIYGVRDNLGFMSEQPYFYEYLTPFEQLEFYSHFYKFHQDFDVKHRIKEVLDITGLSGIISGKKKIGQFSKGMRQRLLMAQAILPNPSLLIFDEPMSGLDPVGRKDFRDIIMQLKGKGCTIFFSTHILSDLENCDRVGIIKAGKLITCKDVKEIKEDSGSESHASFEDTIVNKYMAFE